MQIAEKFKKRPGHKFLILNNLILIKVLFSKVIHSFSRRKTSIAFFFIFSISTDWRLYCNKGGSIWQFFDKNVQILSARVLKVSRIKKKRKNVFFLTFQIHPAHHVL